MKIFDLLAALGNNIFYWDPRSGSNRDWSGYGNDVTPTAPALLTRQGAQLRGTGRLEMAADASLDLGSGPASTIIVYMPEGYVENPDGTNYLWSQVGSGLGMDLRVTSTLLACVIGGASSNLATLPVRKRCLAVSWITGAKPLFYEDGSLTGEGGSILNAVSPSLRLVTLGAYLTDIRQIPSTFGAVLAFSRNLTATEQALVYDALEETVWPSVVSMRSYSMPKIDPGETGLVAGYNMRPTNNKVIDESPGRNDGDIVGALYEASVLGDSMRFTPPEAYVTTAYTGTPTTFSVSGWFNLKSRGEGNLGRLVFKGTDVFELFVDNSDTALNLRYENGAGVQNLAVVGAYTQFLWEHLAVVVTPLLISVYRNGELLNSVVDTVVLDSSAFSIGGYAAGSRDSDGNFVAPKWRERALALDEIKAEYNAGARTVLYKTDWGARETLTGLSNTDFGPISGAFKVVTVDYLGEPHKAIQCVTAGAIAMPASLFKVGSKGAARGGLRWVHQKNAVSGGSLFGVIMSDKLKVAVAGQNGYAMFTTTVRDIRFSKITNGAPAQLFTTTVPVIELGEFNQWGMDVTNAGAFSLLLNEQLIPGTPNPFTDTTFTESNWFIWDGVVSDILLLGNLRGQHGFVKTLGVEV